MLHTLKAKLVVVGMFNSDLECTVRLNYVTPSVPRAVIDAQPPYITHWPANHGPNDLRVQLEAPRRQWTSGEIIPLVCVCVCVCRLRNVYGWLSLERFACLVGNSPFEQKVIFVNPTPRRITAVEHNFVQNARYPIAPPAVIWRWPVVTYATLSFALLTIFAYSSSSPFMSFLQLPASAKSRFAVLASLCLRIVQLSL